MKKIIKAIDRFFNKINMNRLPNENMEPRYWHGTFKHIPEDKFFPFTHFGTMRQAGLGFYRSSSDTYKFTYQQSTWLHYLKGRDNVLPLGASEGAIYEVELDVKRPLRIIDHGDMHNLNKIAALIDETKVLPHRLAPLCNEKSNDREKGQVIIRELRASGYDGLIYANSRESAPNDSVMILCHQQVRVVRRHSTREEDFNIALYESAPR